MYTVLVPSLWESNRDSRYILRLKNSQDGQSVSYSLRKNKPRKIDASDLPGANLNAVVAWVDESIEGQSYSLTERIKINSLHRISDIEPYFSRRLENNQFDTEIGRLHNLVDAWRWITPKDPDKRISPLTKNMLKNLKNYKSDDKSFISNLLNDLAAKRPLNDGSEIINAIMYISYMSKLQELVSRNNLDFTTGLPDTTRHVSIFADLLSDMQKYDCFYAVKTLRKVVAHVTSNTRPAASIDNDVLLKEGELKFIPSLLRGSFTFGIPHKAYIENVDLKFIKNSKGSSLKNGPVVLYSADPIFLRAYLSRVLFYMTVLPEHKYHFHIISKESEANELVELITEHLASICSIRNIDPSTIYFEATYSEVPPLVPDPKSYYAAARYLIASKVMNMHQSSVWIQDVDLYPTGDLTKSVAALESTDISLFKSSYLGGMIPWVRHLAGNVYVRNSTVGHEFLVHVENYIRSFLIKDNSWMIDQNSLSYGVSMLGRQHAIGDTRLMRIPVQQSNLAAKIEGP